MHKSKLAGFIIDCQGDDLDSAASFWGNALGMPRRILSPTEKDRYERLEDQQHGLHIEIQLVSHSSRVHLEIETDNIEAEVQRLEQLGAKRVKQVSRWWVMEAPTGQRFCVVRADSEDFERVASEWP